MHNRDHHLTSAEHIVTPNSMYYADDGGFLVEIPLPTDGSGGYLSVDPVDNVPKFMPVAAADSKRRLVQSVSGVATVDVDLELYSSVRLTIGNIATVTINFINCPNTHDIEYHIPIKLLFSGDVATFAWARDGITVIPKRPLGLDIPFVIAPGKLNRLHAIIDILDIELLATGIDLQ